MRFIIFKITADSGLLRIQLECEIEKSAFPLMEAARIFSPNDIENEQQIFSRTLVSCECESSSACYDICFLSSLLAQT
jgi:hypothetical protein